MERSPEHRDCVQRRRSCAAPAAFSAELGGRDTERGPPRRHHPATYLAARSSERRGVSPEEGAGGSTRRGLPLRCSTPVARPSMNAPPAELWERAVHDRAFDCRSIRCCSCHCRSCQYRSCHRRSFHDGALCVVALPAGQLSTVRSPGARAAVMAGAPLRCGIHAVRGHEGPWPITRDRRFAPRHDEGPHRNRWGPSWTWAISGRER